MLLAPKLPFPETLLFFRYIVFLSANNEISRRFLGPKPERESGTLKIKRMEFKIIGLKSFAVFKSVL